MILIKCVIVKLAEQMYKLYEGAKLVALVNMYSALNDQLANAISQLLPRYHDREYKRSNTRAERQASACIAIEQSLQTFLANTSNSIYVQRGLPQNPVEACHSCSPGFYSFSKAMN